MKGHENKKKIPHSNHRSWGKNGETQREKNACHATTARIYIVGSLVVLERGVMVRHNCNILTLPWKMC